MDEALKRRLIGATVLVSLAIIFIPMLFENNSGVSTVDTAISPVPKAPNMEFNSDLLNVEVNEPTPVLRRTTVVEADIEPVEIPLATETEEKPNVKPVAPKVGLSAWVIQVGSFSKRDNASKLVGRLRKAQFDTMEPERVDLRGRILYRVRVGPVVKRKQADKLLPGIEKVSGLKGQIVRYP